MKKTFDSFWFFYEYLKVNNINYEPLKLFMDYCFELENACCKRKRIAALAKEEIRKLTPEQFEELKKVLTFEDLKINLDT